MERMNIVIVDDEPVNLMLLEEIARLDGYEPLTFMLPLEALEHLKNSRTDLLIVDYNMPLMDGITLLKEARKYQNDLMSIMITANNQEAVRIEALQEGINDFLTKPFSPTEFRLRMKNILRVRNAMKIEKDFSFHLAEEVERATRALRESEYEALRVLSKTAEFKDPETGSHIARVAHYSSLIGKMYGLDDQAQNMLFYGAPLHDIGKVGIEDAILLKPGKLSEEEFEIMKTHAQIGYEILVDSQNPFLIAGAVIAQSHHERYNGKGYPKALKGEEIPLYGRIVAIADVFDALTSKRPYKEAWSFDAAMALIEKEKGGHFDPVLADLFINSEAEVREIFNRFAE